MKIRHQKLLGLLACAALTLAQNAVGADYQSTVLSQGPVGYWRLNETLQPPPGVAATNLGSLGTGANGSYENFPTRGLPGPFTGSSAVGVDGTQDIKAGYQAALNPATFSIEAWVNPASATVPGGLLCVAASMHSASPRAGWLIYQSDGTAAGAAGVGYYLRLYAANGTATSISLLAPQTVVAGTWTHLVFTFDGTTAKAYINGALVGSGVPTGFVPNGDAPFTIGQRSDTGFPWPGRIAEVAYYSSALSAARISAHYSTANTTPANYGTTVLSDSPIVFYRFQEAIDPPTANLGSLGSAANGLFIYDTQAGVAGPSSPPYAGFEAANKAASFVGGSGVVRIPALNLNTNTVTISGWVKASTDFEVPGAGLVICDSGTTYAGLTIDAVYGGLGLGYIWNNDINTYNVSPSVDLGLPTLPASADNQWSYVALVIQPDQASVFICASNNPAGFAGVTNPYPNVVQAFEGTTFFGSDPATRGTFSFSGGIDEVAIFKRALGVGELYTQYGAAVGGVAPKIFADLQGPTNAVTAGDPIVLTIDGGGTPTLTFTWHRNGSTIATTSSGTYTIPTSSFADAGNYDVTISNGIGSPAQSQTVPVTIVAPTSPALTGSSGFLNRTIYPSGSILASVTVTGGGLKYQWYKNAAPISTATTSALNIPGVTTANAGAYSVSVTNSLGTVSNGPFSITITNPVTGSYEALVVASAPEAWWRLGETSGTNLFDGMGRHNGYYTNRNGNVPPVTLGATGALSSDADTAVTISPTYGGYGVIPYAASLNPNQFTIEAWVKTSVLSGTNVPFSSSYNNLGVWCMPNGGFWWGQNPGGFFGNNNNVVGQIIPDQWSHIAVEFNSTQRGSDNNIYPYTLYVNAQTDGFIWGGPTTPNQGGPFIIGARGVSAATIVDRLFDGQVDEVAVYGRQVPQAELLNHFNGRFGASTVPYFVGSFLPQTVTAGKTISYNTTVYGSTPITLRWYKNSSPIAGATTTSLTLSNTVVSDTATYTLWATNSAGVSSQSVAVTVISPVGFANVTNNLVLHLKLEGNETDSSGLGHNGTPVGGPVFVPGIIGSQALQYTTTTATNQNTNIIATSASYVQLGKPSDFLFGTGTSFSVALWVKVATNDAQGDLPFIGTATNSNNNPGWDLSPTYGSGGYQWNLNDGPNNVNVSGPANTINNGGWHHFVMAVDRAAHVVNTYLDGILVAQTDITGLGSVDVGGPVTIGQDPTGTYPFIPGASGNDFAAWIPSASATLDDVGIWRKALSALEVAQIESAGRTAGRSFDTVGPAGVTLTISKSGSNITISWPSGTLYQSDSIGTGAVWTAVPGATAPSYTFTPGSGKKFYRVQ